jgi:hypothetical protein
MARKRPGYGSKEAIFFRHVPWRHTDVTGDSGCGQYVVKIVHTKQAVVVLTLSPRNESHYIEACEAPVFING